MFVNYRIQKIIYLSIFSISIFISCNPSNRLKWENVSNLEIISLSQKMEAILSEKAIQIKTSQSSTAIMELPLTEAFITAGTGEAEVSYRMAAFGFKDSIPKVCNEQSIDSIKSVSGNLVIEGKLSGKGCDSAYTAKFIPKNPRELEFIIELADKSLNRIWFTQITSKDERIFGLGEQFSHFDFKGKKPFLFTEEQGIGRGDQPITAGANLIAGAGGNEYTTYAPIPHYITTANRQIFYENTGYSKFDFTSYDRTTVEFWDANLESGLRGRAWVGSDPKELIGAYTSHTGRMPEMPDWAYGTILGLQGGTKKVTEIVDNSLQKGNPVSALWIQDWCGRRVTNFGDQLQWRWYADESLYPDFKKFVSDMNRKNVKVLGYINPFLADTDPKKPGGDSFTNPMLEEAKSKGYLVRDKTGNPYLITTVGFPAYLIDITNPAAIRWTKDIIKKNMIGTGLSGWMADFGEWLPYDAVLHSGVSARNYHNQYPVEWAKLNREAIREAGKEGQIVFFTRAGFSYSNKYSTLFWLGDQMVSFQTNDGLPSAVLGMITSGISGISLNHSDIGGYTTISNPLKNYHRSKELLLRWAEMSALSPIFRTHEGNRPLKNWQSYQYTSPEAVSSQSDEDTELRFAALGRLHYMLKDYLKIYTKEANKTGLPVVRALYLHYPKDPNTFNLKYQYLLGEDLLVVPVVDSGETSVKGYFPEGSWKHIRTKEVVTGNQWKKIEAKLGDPAAFIRIGSKNEALLEKSLSNLK
ncbi:alpha-glucosidase [Leptospira sp. GIMC2001]|uniref:alpha-glucosidase n=1 Tax=Leptospira sp. GIMC2001 TaxID=1513297 RepID=UPI002349ABDB|nr:alpha-glucosidase [Leptospira sp. GIMC2001]WCL48774.1 alpha-glucosidase [Leptospira sp. GIMC2001]